MRLILLYSGGLDSSYVASMLIRRGHEIIPLHALIDARLLTIAVNNLRRVAPQVHELYIAYHRSAMRLLRERLRRMKALEYTCVACKAMMLIEASRLGEELGADGIVTGETLGQVASQTLPNMLIIHRYARLPVYTPLLALDKHEASNMLGGVVEKTPQCPFLPKRPVTRPDPVLAELVLREAGVVELAERVQFEKIIV